MLIHCSNNCAKVILLPLFPGLNKVWSQICFFFNAVLHYLLQSSLCGQFKSDLVCPVIHLWILPNRMSKPQEPRCLSSFFFLSSVASSIAGTTLQMRRFVGSVQSLFFLYQYLLIKLLFQPAFHDHFFCDYVLLILSSGARRCSFRQYILSVIITNKEKL